MPINPKIDVLKGRIQRGYGLVRQYEFEVSFAPNEFIDPDISKEITDMIQDVSFPARTYSKQPVYYGGPLKNFPYIATYNGEINLTLLLTKNSLAYRAFHRWNESVINQSTNIVRFHDDYVSKEMNMYIRKAWNGPEQISLASSLIPVQLNPPIAHFKIFDVWPESLTEIPMSNNGENDYVRFGVVLSYRRWVNESI